MSVINSMLRDLDRRHAPMPIKGHVLPTAIRRRRTWPRSAITLCILLALIIWSWDQHAPKTAAKIIESLPQESVRPKELTSTAITQIKHAAAPANTNAANSPQPTTQSQSQSQSQSPQTAAAAENSKPAVATKKIAVTREEKILPANENNSANASAEKFAARDAAPVIKQEHKALDDLNGERYQLARAALAQNQVERAYQLLCDNPPPIASATDYHAVLAAVEQQLGHYADASLRYRQLLSLDQNQASWWLGFALSCEGEHLNADALAAYQRAIALNTLPDAARQYARARIAALTQTTDSAQITKTSQLIETSQFTETKGAER